ncbi:MAG TPA: hypothetical protein VK501_01815 [Baekduia sp.]|uniref:hypothetical protein n=1 Tax=Baekduia sp. TaxID=2600305 RepID=UPI002CEC0966|nr:hypothetical protein [Baekduia sp.]HMJ32625.1 hypothetical protein [Baekduia sp.]
MSVLEPKLQEHLRRVWQADDRLRADGRDGESFHLHHAGAGQREIHHPRWDQSWAVPTEHQIDDLGELDMLRVQPSHNKTRSFVMTLKGRAQGHALQEALTTPTAVGGRAPSAQDTLRWLIGIAEAAPEVLEVPTRITRRAVSDRLIDHQGHEALSQRILDLLAQGYLTGQPPDFDQVPASQILHTTQNLAVAMKAYESLSRAEPAASTVNVFGPVVNSQVAAGDITTTTTFVSILAQAEIEIDALHDVDTETKQEAKTIIKTMLGKGAEASAQVMTGAGGALAAAVLSNLLGIPLT